VINLQLNISLNCPLHGSFKAAEVNDLRAEDEVTELSKGQEDDEKHDGKAKEILGASAEGGG